MNATQKGVEKITTSLQHAEKSKHMSQIYADCVWLHTNAKY